MKETGIGASKNDESIFQPPRPLLEQRLRNNHGCCCDFARFSAMATAVSPERLLFVFPE
jgi:hypothetical protein